MSSITDLGVGAYQVNFTNVLSDANYSVSGLKHDVASVLDGHISISLFLSTSITLTVIENNAQVDSDIVTAHIFGL